MQTETINTQDYRLAPSGEGPHAATWIPVTGSLPEETEWCSRMIP